MRVVEGGVRASSFVLLVVAIVVVYGVSLATLGSHGLMDPDEPRYAGSASEMLARGEWWIPYFNDQVRIVKPILIYWEILAAYRLFGEGEFAARLPSWLAGVATLLMTMRMGVLLGGRRIALVAGAAFALSPIAIGMSRLATPDASLGAAVCAAMLVFLEMRRRLVGSDGGSPPEGRVPRLFAMAFGVALAAGFLLKGPVAILLPGLTIGVFLTVCREWRLVPGMRPWLAAVLFGILAAPWFIIVALRPEMGGARVFFDETIGRYFGSEKIHTKPFWYFVPVVLAGTFPWSLDALRGIAGRAMGKGEASSAGESRAVGTFALCWACVVLVFFSLSPNKLPSYMMPIVPAMALLAADATMSAARGGGSFRAAILIEGLLWVALAAAAGFVLAMRYPDAVPVAVPFAAGSLVLGLAGVFLATRGRTRSAAGAPVRWIATRAVALAAGVACGLVWLAPLVEIERSYRVLEDVLAPRARDGDLLVEGWFHQPGYVYYSGQPVVRLDSVDDIVRNLEGPRRVFVLLDEVDYERVAAVLSFEAPVLHRGWGRVLFTNVQSSEATGIPGNPRHSGGSAPGNR